MMTFALQQDRSRDLDHLLLRGPQLACDLYRINIEVQRLQELLGGDIDAAQPVENLFSAEEQILGDGHRRD